MLFPNTSNSQVCNINSDVCCNSYGVCIKNAPLHVDSDTDYQRDLPILRNGPQSRIYEHRYEDMYEYDLHGHTRKLRELLER